MRNLIEQINWDKCEGLIPAVIQDSSTLQVLMLGYMNQDALQATLRDNRVTFFSRTRQELWQKGETSENFLDLVDIQLDCDQDSLLVSVTPTGPTCHLQQTSCFSTVQAPGIGFLGQLEDLIQKRKSEMPSESYTSSLFRSGMDRIAQKVGEEAIETIIAAKNTAPAPFVNEVSDLIYHLLVLLREKDTKLSDIMAILRQRHLH